MNGEDKPSLGPLSQFCETRNDLVVHIVRLGMIGSTGATRQPSNLRRNIVSAPTVHPFSHLPTVLSSLSWGLRCHCHSFSGHILEQHCPWCIGDRAVIDFLAATFAP